MKKYFLSFWFYISFLFFLCICYTAIYCKTIAKQSPPLNTINAESNKKNQSVTQSTDTDNLKDNKSKSQEKSIDFDEKGSIRLFLPLKGKEPNDIFASVSAYLILPPLGYDEKIETDRNGIIVINKKSIDKPIIVPEYAFKVFIRNDETKDLIVADINGLSTNEKEITILGFSNEIHKPEDAVPGQEIFKLSQTLDISEDMIITLDIATKEMQKIDRTISDPKLKQRLAEKRKQKIIENEKYAEKTREEITKEEEKTKEEEPQKTKEKELKKQKDIERFKNISKHKKNLQFAANIEIYPQIIDISTKNDYLYLTSGAQQILGIFDIKDLNNIELVSSFSPKTRIPNIERKGIQDLPFVGLGRIEISDKYAYILNFIPETTQDLLILDISSATSPKLITTYNTNNRPIDLSIEENYVYLVTQKDFQIIDTSDTKEPKLMNSYKFTSGENPFKLTMTTDKKYVYISGNNMGIVILDVSNPKKISYASEIKQIKNEGYVCALEIYKDYLFMSEIDLIKQSFSNLKIFDIKNPVSPALIKEIPFTEEQAGIVNIRSEDHKLYLAMGKSPTSERDLLEILDISDISNPKIIDGYTLPQIPSTWHIYKDSKYLFIGIDPYGVIILESNKQ